MISADPFVPDAANGQSNNRYSYVHNSPLTFTDPSGFIPSHSVAGHLGYGGFHGFGGFGGIQVIPEIPIATPADGIAQQIGIEEVARGRIGSLVGLSRTGWFGSFTPMGRFHMMGSNLADEFSVETPIDANDMNVRSDGLDDTSSRTDVDIASVMPSEMEHCRCFQEYLFCSIA